jgi:thiol-disulfide isomerase/thioredoxin
MAETYHQVSPAQNVSSGPREELSFGIRGWRKGEAIPYNEGMKKLWFLGVLLLALCLGIYRFRSRIEAAAIPDSTAATLAAGPAAAGAPKKDTCEGKKFCAVAYLAPWCPHCKRVVPDLREMMAKAEASSENGLRVIVGGGEKAENEALAALFGASGVVDASNDIARQLGVRGYPSFYLLNEQGHLIAGDEAAYRWAFEKLR